MRDMLGGGPSPHSFMVTTQAYYAGRHGQSRMHHGGKGIADTHECCGSRCLRRGRVWAASLR
jgi:hypothetical protein